MNNFDNFELEEIIEVFESRLKDYKCGAICGVDADYEETLTEIISKAKAQKENSSKYSV